MWKSWTFVFVVVFSFTFAFGYEGSEKILNKDLSTFVALRGEKTAARRSRPIMQLECVDTSSKYCKLADISGMKCNAVDHDMNGDPIWECHTELPAEFKISNLDVNCEGYSYPEDIYILRGSCGVRYSLSLTSEGRDKYGSGFGLGKLIFLIVAFFVIFSIARSFLKSIFVGGGGQRAANTDGQGYGTGGGFGPGPGDDFGRGNGGAPGTGSKYTAPAQPVQNNGWVNFGIGGLVGYLIGRSGNRNRYYTRSSFGGGGSSWGSSGFSSGRSSFGRTSRR